MENTDILTLNTNFESFEEYSKSTRSNKFDRVVKNRTFNNVKFSDLHDIKFLNCVFKECDFTSSIIYGCLFDENTKFYECNFNHTFFDCVNFFAYCDDCSFVSNTMRFSNFNLVNFEECIICDALSFSSNIVDNKSIYTRNEISIRKHNNVTDFYQIK